MADSAAFKPVPASSDHIAAALRADEPPASAQASTPRSAGGLLRPSQVPVPDETTRPTGSPSTSGGRAQHGRQLRPSGAPTGAAMPLARPSTVPARPIQDVLRGPGQPLAAPVKEEMEARLGADFTQVRIHTDSAARASAAEVGAHAYTSGSHVVIGDGAADKHTLAHELTHVIQQRQGPVAGTDHGNGLKVSDPFDVYEKAAEANAARVMRAPFPLAAGPGPGPRVIEVLALQQAAGNRAAASLLGVARRSTEEASARPVVVQRLAMDQARQIALTLPDVDEQWYESVCLPALSSIASRQGQTLDAYVGAITRQDFMATVGELRQNVRSDQPRSVMERIRGLTFRPSAAYPGYQRYKETNLLVSDQELSSGTPSEALQNFIRDYEGGNLAWYRGVGISHFAWGALQTFGALASEGTADNPTFTMGNVTPTRWLPGDSQPGIAQGIEGYSRPAGQAVNNPLASLGGVGREY